MVIREGQVTVQDTDMHGLVDSYKDLADARSERNEDHARMSIVLIARGGASSGANN
jgi:hypothetical protein